MISEWMGYCMLYEGMLDSVIAARNRWMKPNGTMCPSQAIMYLAGVEDSDWMADRFDYWSNVYGFDMHRMQEFYHGSAVVDIVGDQGLLTSVATVAVIN